jgi:hypothetical protein
MVTLFDEFMIHVVAAFVGAGLGLGAAMWWDRRKRHEEIKHSKDHMIDSLIEELKVIQNVVGNSVSPIEMRWDTSSHQFTGSYLAMSTPAFDSAVNSGNFNLLSTALQTQLADLYLVIKECNSISEQILRFYTTPIYTHDLAEREANKLAKFLELKIAEMRDTLGKAFPALESAKR